jgi:hypothetical protein
VQSFEYRKVLTFGRSNVATTVGRTESSVGNQVRSRDMGKSMTWTISEPRFQGLHHFAIQALFSSVFFSHSNHRHQVIEQLYLPQPNHHSSVSLLLSASICCHLIALVAHALEFISRMFLPRPKAWDDTCLLSNADLPVPLDPSTTSLVRILQREYCSTSHRRRGRGVGSSPLPLRMRPTMLVPATRVDEKYHRARLTT